MRISSARSDLGDDFLKVPGRFSHTQRTGWAAPDTQILTDHQHIVGVREESRGRTWRARLVHRGLHTYSVPETPSLATSHLSARAGSPEVGKSHVSVHPSKN